MSNFLRLTFILIGAYFGRTITLGSNKQYPFKNGQLTLEGSAEDLALHTRMLERNWQAYPQGHPTLVKFIKDREAAQAANAEETDDGKRDIQTDPGDGGQSGVQSDLQPDGEGTGDGEPQPDLGSGAEGAETGSPGSVPDGDGSPESVDNGDGAPAPVNEKLLKAVNSLNAGDDAHWTRDGKPAMQAVEQAYGATDITRADVEAVAPGYGREQALKIQSDIQ